MWTLTGGLVTAQLLPQEDWAQTQHSVFLISSQMMWRLVWDYSSGSEGLDQRVSEGGLPISSISTPGDRLEMLILELDPDILRQSLWMCWNLCLNKSSRWFWCLFKFENHWSRIQTNLTILISPIYIFYQNKRRKTLRTLRCLCYSQVWIEIPLSRSCLTILDTSCPHLAASIWLTAVKKEEAKREKNFNLKGSPC